MCGGGKAVMKDLAAEKERPAGTGTQTPYSSTQQDTESVFNCRARNYVKHFGACRPLFLAIMIWFPPRRFGCKIENLMI